MWDNSIITDAGSTLLARWAGGGLLTITGAAAGTGCVEAVALAKQTALANRKQSASIVNYAANANGILYTLQLTAADESYTANQIGIFAKLDNGDETLIAIYQDETGIPIPSKGEMADFVYAFYATIQMNNGPIEVVIDQQACISRADAVDIINATSVRFDAAQALDDAQKEQARSNLGLTVDDALSDSSTNPVQNKAVKAALDSKSPSTHKHSYNDLNDKPTIPAAVTVDDALSDSSTNPVQNKVVKAALDGKQYKLVGSAGQMVGFDADGNAVAQEVPTPANTTLGQGYGGCSTAASTSAKVATMEGFSLETGGIVSIKFTYAVPANATLNINSTGAKNIYYQGNAITAGVIGAGDVATFMYSNHYHLLAVNRVLPPVTTSDSGKFLRVNSSGKYALETVTAAEGVSF